MFKEWYYHKYPHYNFPKELNSVALDCPLQWTLGQRLETLVQHYLGLSKSVMKLTLKKPCIYYL